METVTVSQLKEGMTFQGDLLVRSVDRRTGKTGREYLDMTLCDRTGEINAKVWNLEGLPGIPVASGVVEVDASIELFNGRIQMRINRLRPAVNPDLRQLIPSSPVPPAEMMEEIQRIIDTFPTEDLRRIVREMIAMVKDKLMYYPAAQRMHHAEHGGLLHHTTSMLHTAEALCDCYPFLNRELLLAGVIIHDLSKTHEMLSDKMGNVSDYSPDGILLGHLVRGVVEVEKAAERAGVSGELVLLLQHMVISHHGEAQYGSPRLPMFPEAEALHWIDILDARMNEMQTIQDRTPAGAFSERIAYLDDRRMYHPAFVSAEAEEPAQRGEPETLLPS